ncbi:MAG: NAD(P)/FAD-dependent oxidoreductase [Actinomycetota bacterium]|nr:NAD(P)/FAD-dependent oxidoreductase [Acidimicrobiaceae bacterium]MDC2966428.1 NAD(P)/FAD-dependent oxidoreductase [Acidimicrobiaceae bacterium]MEC7840874.1 NAD(P)/FAD-dependent oxidoreductase [Actinomycetota bacterium]|tara:strand:+ start:384 stop:1625 length:1242 start_codon:yes stop_codon:yes gene_type:complete
MLNVVVIGGGFGGLKFLQRARSSKIQFTLIDKQNHHLFQPLLYQVATAVLSPANIAFPIRRMFKNFKNVKVILDEATDINREDKTVTISSGEKIKYDQLVVSTGSRHSYFGNDGWSEYSNGLKGINDALQIRERLLRAFEKAENEKNIEKRNKYLNFVVVGGGPTGVEMAGSIAEIAYKNMKEEFRNFKSSDANVYLIEATEKILPMYSDRLSGKAEKYLIDFGVQVRTNEKVIKIENDLVVTDKESIETDNVIWAAGNEASPIIKKLNTKTDSEGRAIVDPDCSIKEDGNVFVIGDAANYKNKNNSTLPGIAPVAIQQGKYLAKIIKNKTLKQDRKPFKYYDKGMMATVGRYKAIGKIGNIEISGFIAWLFWSAIHILYLIGYRSKILVVIEWIFSYLFNKKGTRLIYREPT